MSDGDQTPEWWENEAQKDLRRAAELLDEAKIVPATAVNGRRAYEQVLRLLREQLEGVEEWNHGLEANIMALQAQLEAAQAEVVALKHQWDFRSPTQEAYDIVCGLLERRTQALKDIQGVGENGNLTQAPSASIARQALNPAKESEAG